jgi:hypothetical protein
MTAGKPAGRAAAEAWVSTVLLALAAAAFLTVTAGSRALAQDGCIGKAPKLKALEPAGNGMRISVPESWNPVVKELSEGLLIEDLSSGHTLEIVRGRSPLPLADVAALHARLYLGSNRISDDCARELSARLAWATQTVWGLYSQRGWGRWVLALFAQQGDEFVVATLRCPRRGQTPPDWSTALAVFASYSFAAKKEDGKPAGEVGR